MKKWIQYICLLPVIVTPCLVEAQPVSLNENTWSNSEFVKWFTGTYAFNGQINPQINSDEQALFKEIASLMNASPQQAIRQIQTYIDTLSQEGEAGDYSPALDYTMGSLYLQIGDIDSAIRKYNESIKRFPTFRRAFQNLGLAHVQKGDFEAAIPPLTKAIELGATGPVVWGLTGFAYLNTERPTQALTAYDQALLFQPDSKDWRLGKLNALLDAGKRDLAIALLNEMLLEDPEATNLWLQQANAFLGEGNYLDAASNLEWVHRKGEASGQSLLLLGDLYLNEGLVELALDTYQAAIGKESLGPDRLLSVVDGLSARGATEQALSFLVQLKEGIGTGLTDRQQLRALNLEAQLALAVGERDKAATILQEIIQRDPMNGSALAGLGDYYRDNGEMEKAILQYERASQIEEVKIRALLALGRLHVGQRDYRSAVVYLREAQQLEPRAYIADYIQQLERAIRAM